MTIMFAKFIECISRGLTTYVTYRRNTFSDENQFLFYLFEFINFSKISGMQRWFWSADALSIKTRGDIILCPLYILLFSLS